MALTTDLVSYYKFDENAASTTVADAKGSNDLTSSTNTSNLYYSSGIINSAFDFNGTSDLINGTFSQSFSSLSYSFWLAWDDSGTSNLQVLLESETTAKGLVYTGSGSTDSIAVRLNTTLSDALFESAIPNANFHHYVITWDGTNVRLYVDGSEHTSSPISRAWSSPTFSSLNIASRSGGSLYLDGKIDEVGIWSRALTSTEVTELYNSGSGLAYPFSADTNVNVSTLTLSLTSETPSYFIDVTQGALNLRGSILSVEPPAPVIPDQTDGTVKVGTGGLRSKMIWSRYPVTEGLIAGTTKQTRNPDL